MNVDCLYPVGRHFVVRYVCITKTMQDEDIDTEHCVCLSVSWTVSHMPSLVYVLYAVGLSRCVVGRSPVGATIGRSRNGIH